MRSMLSVPLIARDGHLVGVISTHWREVHEPSERELRLLTVLARQAANLIEWRAAEKVLRETEARYRILVDNVLDYAIMLLDADGIITEWTPGAERVKGYAAEDILGRHFRIFYQESDRDGGVPEHELDRAAELGRAENEGWRVRKDGTRFWADEILTAVCDKRGTVTGFTKITRDLTHRMLVESAAERQRQDSERDDYRRQVVAAEENERRRLARELHDQLGQHLAALALGLDEIRRMIGDDTGDRGAGSNDGGREGRSRVASRLHALQGLTTTMTIDARNLALELRPPELDDVGLASALETLVSRWSARTRIAADLEVSGLAGKAVAPDAGTAIYRIVQEALTNVVKHAAAERVSIIVKPTHAGVRLIVEDDGCGFDPATALKRARMDSRLGIAGMRERATLTGGTIAVESEPGSGTTIYVTIPAAIHDGAADNGTAHPGTTHNNEVAAPQVLS
jgi:PAS domain S-box-containing protein